MAKLVSTNPAKNYEVFGEVNMSTQEEIRDKVQKANSAPGIASQLSSGENT